MGLRKVETSTGLAIDKVYYISGYRHQYLHSKDTRNGRKYVFRPLPGQRCKVEIELSQIQLSSWCQEIEGELVKPDVEDNTEQLALF